MPISQRILDGTFTEHQKTWNLPCAEHCVSGQGYRYKLPV